MKEQNTSPKYIFLGIGLIIAYQIILPQIYFSIFYNQATSTNFWTSNLTYVGYYLTILIGLIFLFRKSLKEEWKNFLNHKKEFIKIGLTAWIKGLGLMIIGNLIALSIVGNIAGNEAQNRNILTTLPLYAITSMCLIGPFIEELVFRKSFRKSFQNKYIFAIFTSFIFALLHVLNSFNSLDWSTIINNWQQLFFLIPYGSLAFFFALSYYETDNIFTSISAHCFHNTLTVILVLLTNLL